MSEQCRICRTSTQNTDAKQLFETEQNALILQIELVTGEWLNYDRDWPTYICMRCEDELNVAVAFRGRCMQTQQELRLELVTGEANLDHLDPLNITHGSDVQYDQESTTNTHFEDELIIKDEHLDDEDSTLIFKCNSVKKMAEIVADKNNEQNDVPAMQEEGKLEKQLKSCKDRNSEMNANDKANQVQLSQMATILISHKRLNKHLIMEQEKCMAEEQLKEKESETKEGNFICDQCGKEFLYKKNLLNHIRRHMPEKNVECITCKKMLSTKQALRNHERMHTNRNQYHCELCDESFTLHKNLKRHELTKKHNCRKENKPNFTIKELERFVCDICGKHSETKSALKDHLLRHTGVKDFECHVCKNRFYSKSALTKHEIIHTDVRNYHCELCDESFKLFEILKKHKLTKKHKNKEEKAKHKPSFTDEQDWESSLAFENNDISSTEVVADRNVKQNQLQNLHGDGLLEENLALREIQIREKDTNHTANQLEKSQVGIETNLEKKTDFVCDKCGAYFSNKYNLSRHVFRNKCKKEFECSKCEKRFSRELALRNHNKIHIDVRNYHCELCNESFKLHKHLRRHELSNKHLSKEQDNPETDEQLKEKTFETINKFICDHCGKGFPYKKGFMEHLHRHRGIKDFECNICKKQFALETELQKHFDTVHAGIKRYSCKYCDMKFKYTQTKTYHIRKFHTFQLPFKCRYCEKAFITGTMRKSHEAVHSNVRKYHCKCCDKYFKQYSGFKIHERTKEHNRREENANKKQS